MGKVHGRSGSTLWCSEGQEKGQHILYDLIRDRMFCLDVWGRLTWWLRNLPWGKKNNE